MEAVWNACEKLMKEHSSAFYQAFRGLPSPRREAVYIIYAFCRIIDNSVDKPKSSPYTLKELHAGFLDLEQAEGHFIWPALRWLFCSFPQVPRDAVLRQLEGQERNAAFPHYESMAELEVYCYLVAGTVWEMLLPVLCEAGEGHELRASGIALGKAMQIVNIIRNVGEDLKRNRRYIPLELMRKHGYSQQELESGVVNRAWIKIVNELEVTALEWLQIGLRQLHVYPPESAFSIELAAVFYVTILEIVEQNSFDVFNRRALVDEQTKQELFLRVAERHGFTEVASDKIVSRADAGASESMWGQQPGGTAFLYPSIL